MEIIEVPIERLKEYNKSVRVNLTTKDKEFKNLVNSIAYFGLQYPLLINKDFMVISGNQILKVLKYLQYKTVPCIVASVSKDKEWRLNISLNRIRGDWQVFKLQNLFKERRLTDKELSILGFNQAEIDSLVGLSKFEQEKLAENFQGELF